MIKSNKNVTKLLTSVIITVILLLAGSCQNWMSSDDFMSKIEDEVHVANAKEVNVFVRYAHDKMGKTEPTGNTKMKVDVATTLSAVTGDDYGFKKWAAFSTKDFPTNKNHSNLIYISEESYNENFKENELPESEVVFTKPAEPITEVKILKNRDDIFIIPIVASRPTYVQSVPAGGDYNVVKNTSIRILFSKAIKKDTIYDDDGKLNYSITSSAATLVDDDQEIVANDITDYFDWKLSDSGKMLTLSLKKAVDAEGHETNEIAHYLDNRQRITITLFEGLCDTDGFTMNGNYTFSFQTGTSTDSLAPMIEVIFGGTGDKCNVFVSYHNVDENGDATINGVATDAAKNAPVNIDSTEYTDALVAQRIYDKLNIFVKATDIIASGNADINPAKDLNEDNVNAIGIAASLWIDKDGKAVKLDETNSIAKKNYVYISGTIDPNSQMTQMFNEVVPVDKDGNAYTGGTIYTYDVSSLPDGLIKIDVWGIDMTGNSGGPNDAGSPYYTKHDNGYKSIFVVKDTTPPDSATEAKKLKSNSEQAPYFWYNNATLTSMKLYDLEGNQIVDAGHAKLRSLTKNLQWNFVVGNVDKAPDAKDAGWKLIHDQDTGASIKYDLGSAKAPAKDGPVDITMFIRDDIGNVSKPVLLNSVMYDNTQPTVKLKSGKGDFVKADGEETLHVSESKVISQILKVEIGEENVDNAGSGIRRIEIHVKKGGQDVALPLDPTTFAVKYAPASIANPTPASAGIRNIDIVAAADDEATTNNIKVFKVTDADKITSGTLFIYGITLDDADGQYEVLVDLYDSALNKTPKTAKTIMARDTTDPIIDKVQVMDVVSRKVYGHDDVTWWLPYNRFEDANNLSKVTLKITAKEAGSGLKYLKLAENAEFTENTKLYVGSELLTRDKDYKLNTTSKTIELLDWYTPKLINANDGSHEITLENIKLNNINAPAGTSQGNKIKLTTDDFVGKTTDNANNIYYGDTSVTGTLIYADSVAPQIASLTVEDSKKNAITNPDDKAYDKDNFTDSQTVVLYLTLGDTEVGNKGSGVNKVILSDNAVFTGTTEIFVVNGSTETKLASPADYRIDSDNKTVNFTKVFTETNKLKFTNVNIISAVNGPQIIKADVQDFAGIKSVTSKDTNAIIFDNVEPVVSAITWIPDNATVTAGTTNTNTILNQNLKVDFTEVTAGVKVLKMEIIHQDVSTTPYAIPFGNASDVNFKLFDESNTELVKGTDYVIDGQYIILTKPKTTGSLSFRGITLKAAREEGTYNVKVSMLDAAELKAETSRTIVIDTVAPVITKDLEIKGHKESVELTNTTSSLDGKWLAKEWIGGSNKAPDSIPVYITVKEKSSGVKVLKFANSVTPNSVTLDADRTTLYTVDSTGVETEVTPRSRYEVVPATKEIIIKSELDAKTLFSRQDESEFKILVKNIGFENADSASKESINSISLIASDIAKNDSLSKSTTESRILSDSISPAAPASLTLKDRGHSTANKTIEASAGYTNESIVDMTFNLTASEQFGSGYHKFVLTGASFIGGDTADKTTITVKDSSGTVLSNVEFALSADGKTLTLKKTGQATDVYAVIRQAVSVELKNVQLDNASTNGSHTVTLKAYDLTGWDSTAASTSITLDTEKPALEKGVFAANYTNSSAAYYQPSINVYPHASGESATGVPINYGTETYQKDIPTFYTATTYKTSGYYQYKGQVSSSSSSVNTDFDHGAVLGIRAKDDIRLGGWTRAKTFLYYYKYTTSDTLFSKTEADILGSTNPTLDINNKGNNNNQPNGNNSQTATTLWFGFDEGKYSAVIVDEAGNCSDVFHFAVVRDVDQPKKSTTAGNANNLNERVLLQKPDASANIFTNSAVSTIRTSDGFPRFWGCGSSQDTMSANSSMKTKKYVTKKSSNTYKIQLNLGGTVSSPTLSSKINGGVAGNVTAYSDLTATATSSPIEKYAVSTLYGSWPDDDHPSYKYCPVVPSGTSLPSGQTYSDSSSICKDYFGYTNGFSDSWYIYNSSSANWHPYKTSTSSNTDSYSYSSLSVSITSYVDSNNNLIIEIPNTKSTVPISVFLKDGCGNMQYVVCGLYQESGYDVAISFVIDDKLGSAPTSDGVVTTPFIIQFPYSYYDSEGSDVPWGGYNFHAGTQSGNSEAPSSQYGTGAKRGFVKDFVKHATYYNPKLSNSSETLQFKHGFALHFFPNGVDRNEAANITGKEDITFSDADWSDTEKAKGIRKASATDITAGNYTCRALMYCTNSPDTPTYAQIKACHDTEMAKEVTNRTGQVTDWSYVQVSSSAIEAILFVDYPKPNYTKLNWNVNENNGEPKPFYMWYIFEDAVGNYELAKVVNDATSGNYLKTTNSSHFDKWLYDAEAPKLTIRGTSIDPSTITAANISQLVPTNNGFVPYVNGNNIYVHASKTHTSVQSGGSLNNPTSLGITQTADNSEGNYSKYNSFVDLEVSERTGVRMYAWTTSANSTFDYPTSSTYYGWRDYWLTTSDPYWYVGYGGISPVDKDIGNGSYSYDGCPQSAYYYGNTNTAYTGVYAGVKICTTIPYGKLSTSTATELWLHVMDWTGNISHYRMGASGVKFINDSTAPDYTSTAVTGTVVPDQYYIEKGSGTPTVRIAGNGSYANTTDKKNIKLYIPTSYFTETGSGIKGFSFNGDGTGIAAADDGGLYLTLTYNQYHYTDTNSHSLNYYIYDNVGNRKQLSLNIIYDNIAPKIENIALVIKGSTNKINKIADTVNGLISNDTVEHPEWGFDCYNNYAAKPKNGESTGYTQYHASLDDVPAEVIQNIYINNSNVTKLHINIDDTVDHSDIVDVIVNKWNGSAWEEKSSVAKWIANPDSSTVPKWFYEENTSLTTTNIFHMGSDNTDGYATLEYNRDGTYYQIVAQDISGNTCCQYFKLILDDEAPALTKDASNQTIKPAIILGKGSINSVTAGTGSSQTTTYYYTSDAEHLLKLSFAVEDKGVGTQTALNTIKYCLTNSATESDWTTITNNSNFTISIPNSATAVETIYFKDILGNITAASAAKPGFTYTYTDTASTQQTEDISKLTKYTGSAPAAPSITEGEMTQTIQSGWSSQTVKYSIIQEIQTAGNGMNDEYEEVTYDAENPVYTHLYTQKLSGNTVLIKGKGDDEIERQKLKITFPTKNYIIGYLKSDTPIQQPTDPATDANKYSFATLEHEFIEDLPLAGTDAEGNKLYTSKNRYYYAVDVVGNISSALEILYSYEDPHVAKDITFIMDPANSSASASDTNYIDSNVKTQMINDGISFANFVEGTSTVTDANKKKPGILYFNDGWIILRCTLQEEAGGTYSETPRKVVMYDGYYDNNGKFKVISRGESDSQYFKYYCLSEKNDDNRYYCWIAFKPGKKKNNTWAVNNYDNNDEYDGAKIYFRITGTSSNSEYSRWNTDENSSNYDFGWKLDNGAPYINNTNFYTTSDNKKILKSYVISDAANTVDSQNKFVNPIVSGYDYIDTNKRETNLIPAGSKIYYQVRKDSNNYYFIDNYSGGVQFKFVSSEGYTATASAADSGWADLAMPEGVNAADFNGKGHYYFTLPEVTEPNHYIALFFKDALGNVSEPYYLGDKSNGAIKTWLTDKDPTNVTTDATYVEGTSTYDISLNIDSGAAGAVIKTVEAVNANIESVTFNGYTSQPTFSGTTFQNNEAWINNSGLTVRIKDVTQDWSPKNVKVKINGREYGIFTVGQKSLSAADVNISDAVNNVVTLSSSTGAPLATLITSVQADNDVTATLSENNTTVTLGNIPAASWDGPVDITLTINGDATISKKVMTVAQRILTAADIEIGDAVEENGAYSVALTLKNDAPATAITSAQADNGVSANLDGTTVTLTNIPAATWENDIEITLKINDNAEISKKVLTIAKKTLTSSDIGIAMTANGAAITEYADDIYYLVITLTPPTGVTISKVTSGDSELTLNDGKYAINGNGTPIPQDVTISVVTNAGTIENIRLFPDAGQTGGGDPGVNENFIMSKLFGAKGSQEVYTFGDSPKSAAALQSHVVEVPKFIQKFWQNDETAADEVTSTVTKEAKKAEKKFSKKTSKKAAKKAVEAVTETAAALEVTELPVEALEEAKADDQLAMILPQTANTEEAELVEPQASVSAGAVDVSVTEAEPVSEKHSSAAIWVVLLAVLSSVAGLIFLKKRKVSV